MFVDFYHLSFRILFQCALVSPALVRGRSSTSNLTQDSVLADITSALASVPIDDITILLKKFSASLDPKYFLSLHFLYLSRIRRIGISGHVAHIIEETIITSALVPEAHLSSQISITTQSTPSYVSRLNKLLSLSSSDCSTLIFCLDELIEAFKERYIVTFCHLNFCSKSSSSKFPLTKSHLTTWLRGVMEDRIYTFLGGIDDEIVTIHSENVPRIPSSRYYDVNGPPKEKGDPELYVKIYDTVYEDMMRRATFPSSVSPFLCHDQDIVPALSPILTLLTTCQSIVHNDLTELGLLLGAPVELPREVN